MTMGGTPADGGSVGSATLDFGSPVVTDGGLVIDVRPLRPDDTPLVRQLLQTLSPQSIYFRFHQHLNVDSQEVLWRLTRHADDEVVLTAIEAPGGDDRMLAMGRIIGPNGSKVAEFAVIVGDPWQGLGVGAELLRRLITIARGRANRTLWGLVLPDNVGMIALGRKLGGKIVRTPGSSEIELVIPL